jgi:serine/threonine-protein kinase
MQTASGLSAAHAQGLVHRDIKPANILLENGVERVKITDFGLARAVADASLTQSGVVTGTPHYMAPEQARGEDVDHRADLFGLGCTVYAMCAGHPPFRADTPLAVLRRITDEPPRPLRQVNADVPAWLDRIVGRLLAKKAADRYQTAAEVAELFERCLAHVQQPMTVALPRIAAPRSPVRWRAAGALVAAAAAVTVALAAWPAGSPPPRDDGTPEPPTPPQKPVQVAQTGRVGNFPARPGDPLDAALMAAAPDAGELDESLTRSGRMYGLIDAEISVAFEKAAVLIRELILLESHRFPRPRSDR